MPVVYKRNEETKKILEKVHKCIDDNGGIAKKEQFTALGIDYRRILDFLDSKDIIRIKNGYYTHGEERFTEEELVAKLFPDGLLCMESALYVYGYLTKKPHGFHIAIDKNTSKSRFKMDYPKIIPYYTEPESLKIGATSIEYEGCTFGIYDKDRLICDCLKYESKMEREDFKQALQAYIKDDDKDISALMEYAR